MNHLFPTHLLCLNKHVAPHLREVYGHDITGLPHLHSTLGQLLFREPHLRLLPVIRTIQSLAISDFSIGIHVRVAPYQGKDGWYPCAVLCPMIFPCGSVMPACLRGCPELQGPRLVQRLSARDKCGSLNAVCLQFDPMVCTPCV